jgi:hypothetical protein
LRLLDVRTRMIRGSAQLAAACLARAPVPQSAASPGEERALESVRLLVVRLGLLVARRLPRRHRRGATAMATPHHLLRHLLGITTSNLATATDCQLEGSLPLHLTANQEKERNTTDEPELISW